MRKRIGSVAAILVLGASALTMAMPGSAGAATTATTAPTTNAVPTSCSVSTTITVSPSSTSSAPATATLTATSCPFAPGSAVTLSSPYNTQTVNADATTGQLTLTFGATDVPTLSVNGGTFQSAVFGVNTITATGKNASGATNTATFLVDIESAATATTTTTATGTGSGSLAFTGADLAALIAAALALILMGTAVVIYTRRRAAADHKG